MLAASRSWTGDLSLQAVATQPGEPCAWHIGNTLVTIHQMDVYQALSDPVRRGLLRQLVGGPRRVVDLTVGRDISRPAVSRHLRVLSEAGLVRGEDHGRERHYRLDATPLAAVKTLITELEDHVVSPMLSPSALEALELEVRRVAHDRRRHDTHTTSIAKDTA